jgi:hypothetical protein
LGGSFKVVVAQSLQELCQLRVCVSLRVFFGLGDPSWHRLCISDATAAHTAEHARRLFLKDRMKIKPFDGFDGATVRLACRFIDGEGLSWI